MSKKISGTEKKVFFHVGLQRTGSTFLQRNVFPAFKGIDYIKKKDFSAAPERINQSDFSKILVSREFNKSFETGITDFAEKVHHSVYPIIVLRKHEDWLLSQYKRHVKNGYNQPIESFFHLDGSRGYLNSYALDFYDKLQFLKKKFKNDPIVLFHEEMEQNASEFISRLGNYLDTDIDWNRIKLDRLHTSYSEHQLKFLYWSYQKLVRNKFTQTKAYRYLILYLAKLIPSSWLQKTKFVEETYMQRVKDKYQQDWQDCLDFASNQSK